MQFGDEEDIGEGVPEPIPTTTSVSKPNRFPVKVNPPAPVFHPLAYRGVVAAWPVEWRERWGRRANALEEKGLSWRDAETQAFVEIWKELRGLSAEPAASDLESSGAERN